MSLVVPNDWGGDLHFSLTEKVVGKWIDDKPIYQKTVYCSSLPAASQKNIPHGISNLKLIVSAMGIVHWNINGDDGGCVMHDMTSDSMYCRYRWDQTNIQIFTKSDWSASEAYFTFLYTL